MKYVLLLAFVLGILNTLPAQNFEYAITQQELAGAKIEDILLVQDRIYLAGGAKDEGNAIIIVFDTSGTLLEYQTYVPEKPDLWYGSIFSLRYDEDQDILIATASVAPGCDFGDPAIFSWKINTNLERINEFEYTIPGVVHLPEPNIRISDTLTAISIVGKTAIYNQQNNLYRQVSLPDTLFNPLIIFHQENLIAFDDYQKNLLQRFDMNGNLILSKNITRFLKIELVENSLIAAGADGKIRVYDAESFEMIDSLFDSNFSEVEFYKINEQLLEIAFYQKEMPSKSGIYDLDLKLVHSIDLTLPYERKIRSAIDASGNLYQTTTYYRSNIDDPRNDGLIPLLRKISLQDQWTISSPELEITAVKISNPDSVSSCLNDTLNNVCMYLFDNLHYNFTIQNNGDEIIDNFGHYVGTVSPTFCGYFYQEYRYYKDLDLAPGQSMTITDSTRLHWVADAPKLNFYVVGPNHLLATQEGSVYTVEDISTSIFQSNPPESLSIYPNPVADFLTINQQRSSPNSKIEIFSISGQKINLLNSELNIIDTRELKPGMYYIRMQENQKTYLGSFVKME